MKYVHAFLLLAITASAAWADAPAVKVNIQWEYKKFSDTVAIYEVKGAPRLWETRSVPSLKAAPVGELIEGSVFSIQPGQKKRFALVVKNTSDKPIYFFAAPHVVHPVEHSLGFKFKCLCINHAYTINPKETWYRIVEFRLANEFEGDALSVLHSIIGIDQKRADSFSKEAVIPEL